MQTCTVRNALGRRENAPFGSGSACIASRMDLNPACACDGRRGARVVVEVISRHAMPLSGDRYLRDLRRYNLAMRFFGFGARPNTVRAWTGFSYQRIRQVFRNYLKNRSSTDPRCDRGPNPTNLGRLLSNPTLRRELTVMGGVCRLLHIIPEDPIPNARASLPSVFNGERLCHALELYYRMVPHARLTLEQ